ncbi:MAG: response regulator transcription factor [Flavobacteriaceae bacterium]|nr:response regulator transcription factor [Flavobacteriaceae bacterium]
MKSVVIIEDYEILLNSFTEIVNTSSEYYVKGAFTNCEQALNIIENLQPDIVLIDITLPGMSGLEGIPLIKEKCPKTLILVITVHENSEFVFKALYVGAIGYVTKTTGANSLINFLDIMVKGGAPMSINIARMVVESFQVKNINSLTKKENEVLHLLSKGKSYISIAESLDVKLNTIKYHIRNIYEKLHVTSKDELINIMSNKNK